MAKKKKACGKGWFTLEIRRNGKIERVCARFAGKGKKPKGVSWKTWVEGIASAAAEASSVL